MIILAALDSWLSPRWIVAVCGAWLVVYAAASRYRLSFRCPRCLDLFFGTNARAQHCASCGLRLMETSELPRAPSDNRVTR
jgi:hypothetical protein